jgi:hypothetical protein
VGVLYLAFESSWSWSDPQSVSRRVPYWHCRTVDMSACTHIGISTNWVRTLPKRKN